MAVSALMAVINIFRKLLSFKLDVLRLSKKEHSSFLSKKNIISITVNTLLLLCCPIPFLNGMKNCGVNSVTGKTLCYEYNDYLHILQFYKLYYIVKAFSANTEFASSSSHRACQIYGFKNHNTFVIKCMMREIPIKFILFMFVFGTVFFGYAFRITESPLMALDKSIDLSSYFDCCWLSVLIMTTVGYGDVYPRTAMGRLITFVAAVYGSATVSLMVSFVTQELHLSLGELKAYAVINRLELRKELKDKSAAIINKFGKYLVLSLRKDKSEVSKKQKDRILKEITHKNKDIKNINNEYKAVSDYTPDEDLERNFIVIMNEMRVINNYLGFLNDELDAYNSQHLTEQYKSN